ncbi:MAG TPA: helicase HerA-like domain-containing protein, partial [Vitreimonas sp.]|nr:helicase HerA-like domain-containing protein [Vitreimonas sp.]
MASTIEFGASPEGVQSMALKRANRHGLIAGATGTGKTKTLQLLTEQLSARGVPVFVADVKGDLSGLATPGESSDRVTARATDV